MAPMAGWLHVSIHLWPLRLLVPFPFRYGTTHMQAVGRRPQTAPDLWSRVPGAGAREERRGGLRWYPECTQKRTRTARSPPAQNSALTISCSSLHTHIAGQTDMQLALGIKRYQTHYQAPGRGRRGPTRERDGTKQPSLISQSLCRWKLLSQPQIIEVGFATRFPGPTLAALPIAPIRAAGSHQPTPHPSSTLPHSLNPQAHPPRDAKACVSHRLLQYRAASAS